MGEVRQEQVGAWLLRGLSVRGAVTTGCTPPVGCLSVCFVGLGIGRRNDLESEEPMSKKKKVQKLQDEVQWVTCNRCGNQTNKDLQDCECESCGALDWSDSDD